MGCCGVDCAEELRVMISEIALIFNAQAMKWMNSQVKMRSMKVRLKRLQEAGGRDAIRASIGVVVEVLEAYAERALRHLDGDPPLEQLGCVIGTLKDNPAHAALFKVLSSMISYQQKKRQRSSSQPGTAAGAAEGAAAAKGDDGDDEESDDPDYEDEDDEGEESDAEEGGGADVGSEEDSEIDEGAQLVFDLANGGAPRSNADSGPEDDAADSDDGADDANADADAAGDAMDEEPAPKTTRERKLTLLAFPLLWMVRIGSQKAAKNWTFLMTLMAFLLMKGKTTKYLVYMRSLGLFSDHSAVSNYLLWRAAAMSARLYGQGPRELVPGVVYSLSWMDNFQRWINLRSERVDRQADSEQNATVNGYVQPRSAAAYVPSTLPLPAFCAAPAGAQLDTRAPQFICTNESSDWYLATVPRVEAGAAICSHPGRLLPASDAVRANWHEFDCEADLWEHAPQLASITERRLPFTLVRETELLNYAHRSGAIKI